MAGARKKGDKDKEAEKERERLEKETEKQDKLLRKAAIDLLREDFGDEKFSKLPKEVLGIDSLTFTYKGEQPTENPDLTVWALMNALKGSSTKGFAAIDSTKEVRLLELNLKTDSKSMKKTAPVLNFRGSQNCDTMLRHLYGDEREDTERCNKCTGQNGAFNKCIVSDTHPHACANCDWNRSSQACSLGKQNTKRKADDFNSDSDSTDPMEDFDRKTLLKMSKFFKDAADKKKRKKGATPSKKD